jgi:hypothetical protein
MNENINTIYLFDKFTDWLNINNEAIDERWRRKLEKTINKARKKAKNTFTETMGTALWILNVISTLGVIAGVGVNGYKIHHIVNSKIDRESTNKLLEEIVKTFKLQYNITIQNLKEMNNK